MSLIEKAKNFLFIDEIEEEEITEEEVEKEKARLRNGNEINKRIASCEENSQILPLTSNKINNSCITTIESTGQVKLIVIQPKSFDDCKKLADNLKNRRPVIVDFSLMMNDNARKMYDFLNGATYILSGRVQKITKDIFLFAPPNIDLDISKMDFN